MQRVSGRSVRRSIPRSERSEREFATPAGLRVFGIALGYEDLVAPTTNSGTTR